MTDPTVDLWALDEVHFQQHGSRCRMWIPPEVRDPILLHAPTRKSIGYFGAVRLRDGKFVSREESTVFDAATTWAFLKQLRHASARAARRVVVILDNASFHHARLHRAWRARCPGRFDLCYLPPYSPDLNPCERVWKLTRRLCTHNRYFARLVEVRDAASTQFLWRGGRFARAASVRSDAGGAERGCTSDAGRRASAASRPTGGALCGPAPAPLPMAESSRPTRVLDIRRT